MGGDRFEGQLRLPAYDGNETVRQVEFRFQEAGIPAAFNHVANARAHAFDVFGEIERFRKQRIAGNRAVRLPEPFQCQRGRQSAGVPYLQPVGEEHHLNAAVAGVVTMGYRIYDRLSHHLRRHLVSHRCLRALLSRAYSQIDLGEHKIHGLIYQIEGGSLVNLVEGNGLSDIGSMEMSALDLGRDKKTLWLVAEEKNRGVGRQSVLEQVQVLQHMNGECVFRERKASGAASDSQEEPNFLGREVFYRGVRTGGGIEGTEAEQFFRREEVHQTGIDGWKQLGR